MQTIGDILKDTILGTVFTSDVCTFCQREALTYTDPETRCRFCLDCLVIATEPGEELPEDPEIVQIGQDYIRQSRSKQSRIAA